MVKILSTEGLTKLIQLIKGTFVSNNDISTVARTGDYADLSNKPTIPSRTSELYNDSGYVNSTALNNKQDRLISGDNIKTINGSSVLGSGDLVIQSGGDPINNRDGVSHLPMWEGTQTQWNQYSNSNWYCWEAGLETYYTLDENPTTSSIVYESPNNRSNLTVTSYDSGLGTLTLSDGNTYDYTASSDITAWRNVADAHPDWLCHIEGVGVKKGDTLIASKIILDTTPTQDSGNGITSGAVYTALGDIETLINAL